MGKLRCLSLGCSNSRKPSSFTQRQMTCMGVCSCKRGRWPTPCTLCITKPLSCHLSSLVCCTEMIDFVSGVTCTFVYTTHFTVIRKLFFVHAVGTCLTHRAFIALPRTDCCAQSCACEQVLATFTLPWHANLYKVARLWHEVVAHSGTCQLYCGVSMCP